MGRAVEAALRAADDLDCAVLVDPELEASPGPPPSVPNLDSYGVGTLSGIIDFSSPEGHREALAAATRIGCPFVSGTTGLDDSDRSAMQEAGERIPVCWAPNFSIGVSVLDQALRRVAAMLPESWQIEIVDIHHAQKKDAPSGTALRFAETWRKGRGGATVYGRHGMIGARNPEEIGVHALRIGEVVGEHRILLGGPGETLEAVHRVGSRAAFAGGSCEALRRLLRKGPGWYEWEDLLRDA
jgi:4-hydroxy-tetrahydrodipicolinate reductase